MVAHGVALDNKKAFDQLWHAALICKLRSYGLPEKLCRRVADFLFACKIYFEIDGFSSSSHNVNAGVPQGSVLVIQEHYKNGAKIKNMFRALREHFGRNNRPNETTIGRLVRKFEATGSVANLPGSGRPRSVRTPENIDVVKESVRDDPKQSTTRRSQEWGISRTSLLRILHKDLNVHAYKIQLTQEPHWLLEHRQIDANFSSKIMFSDEAHFTLNGTVNKQNCRIWANENPREYQEQPMHPQKVTDYFLPQLEGMDMDDVYFQQDGATCHTTNVNIHRLQSFFGDRVISRRGNVPWPPRSCDLTPLDFFLWGYLKSKVYVNKPATLQELKNNIIAKINAIEPTMLQNVVENFDHRELKDL
ncbi:unnamed protein product [Acanthoscelides obtectus]|uniref:DUF4817 domain-containing protein n=1 Tax=Acanthoscelides obtectus TaxID=200917 RepID=A0A9P0LDX8_ACAOB|nr:unnamed protein product [Acanthoscelides obtectus]CAK1658865.1 RNA-directed DNA polymerase from mobile element jockey [Acanthoscelides obtectus]